MDPTHRLIGHASREQHRVDGGSWRRGRQFDAHAFAVSNDDVFEGVLEVVDGKAYVGVGDLFSVALSVHLPTTGTSIDFLRVSLEDLKMDNGSHACLMSSCIKLAWRSLGEVREQMAKVIVYSS